MFQVSFTLVTDFYQECRKKKNAKYCKIETDCMLHVADVCSVTMPRIFTENSRKFIVSCHKKKKDRKVGKDF